MNSIELEETLKNTVVESISHLIIKENKHLNINKKHDKHKIDVLIRDELKKLEKAGLMELKKIRYNTMYNKISIKYLPLTNAYKIINKVNKHYQTVDISINEHNEALGVYDQLERILLVDD